MLHNNLGGVAGYYCEACKQRLLDGTSYYQSPTNLNAWLTCDKILVGGDCSILNREDCECDTTPSQVAGCEGKNIQDQCSTRIGALPPTDAVL